MSIFQSIRNLFGLKTEIQDSPIEKLDKIIGEEKELKDQLTKAQAEFDQYSEDIELKIKACDKLIEKGEGGYIVDNKKYLSSKLDRLTDEYIDNISSLSKAVKNKEDERVKLESDILSKSLEITSFLSEEDQREVGNLIKTWELTGIVKGEEYDSHLKAIVASLEYINNIEKAHSESSEIHELKIPEKQSFQDHYANVIVKRTFKAGDSQIEKILFLKRAADKVIAPNKYCLPGGHIDEGETIEEAGLRELKEEAGLTAENAYVEAKAKCEDGKWAFYLRAWPQGDVMLLDGENVNAAWMTEEEWLEADLLFDLKDHLKAIECRNANIDNIPEIKKAEEEFIIDYNSSSYTEELSKAVITVSEAIGEGIIQHEEIVKGKKASVGEKRTWGGIEYVKTNHGWIKTKDNEDNKKKVKDKEFKHSTDQIISHAENTSSDQLKKIAEDETKEQHLRDAAKRELERREGKDKGNSQNKNTVLAPHEMAKNVQDVLKGRGIELNVVKSSTDYGDSAYLVFQDSKGENQKVRISDHSVSNSQRMANEIHYNVNGSNYNAGNIANNIERLMKPDKYEFTESKDGKFLKEGKRGEYKRI